MKRTGVARHWLRLIVFLAVIIVASACGGGGTKEKATSTAAATATTAASAAEIPTLDITTTDAGFSNVPDSIPGGLTRIRLHNAGTPQFQPRTGVETEDPHEHQAQLFRLNEGATPEQLVAALDYYSVDFQEAERKVFRVANWATGAGFVPPGETSEVVVDLAPGRYVLLDVNLRPTPHWRTGELQALEVTAPPAQRPAEPEAQATIGLRDFAFDAPDALPAGKVTVKVPNAGAQRHEVPVLRLNEGVTADQATQAFTNIQAALQGRGQTPAPVALTYTPAGGVLESFPGTTTWMTLDLKPGVYALVCFLADPNTGKAHFEFGMYHVFTVR